MLYNHHNARKAAHDRGAVIAVEGYVDVIAMTRRGLSQRGRAARHRADARAVRTAVADGRGADPVLRRRQGRPQGRAPGDRHRAAAAGAGPKSLRFAFLPDGQDPDDLARSGGQAGGARACSSGAKPLVDVLWTREVEAGPLDTPERRAALRPAPVGDASRTSRTRPCAAIIRKTCASGSPQPAIPGGRAAGAAWAARRRRPVGQFRARQGGQGGRGGRFQPPGQQAYRLQPVPASACLREDGGLLGDSAGRRRARRRSCSPCIASSRPARPARRRILPSSS